jgi:hypothetical protein
MADMALDGRAMGVTWFSPAAQSFGWQMLMEATPLAL